MASSALPGTEEYLRGFLDVYLPQFPDDIILKITNLLNFDYIVDFVLAYQNPIRNVVIEEFYSKEVHFVISPTQRPYVTTLSPSRRQYVTFKSYFEIKQFLDEYPDINPAKLLLVSGGDFLSMKTLLQDYNERFTTKVKALDITLDDHDLTSSDLEFLLSLPNLKRIHFSGIDLSHIKKFLVNTPQLANHEGLEKIVFLGHSLNKWKGINFPRNLRHLDLSWNNNTDPASIALPETLRELYLNHCGINNASLRDLKLPSNLHTLMLTYNAFDTFDVSLLPRSLEVVDLSYNGIEEFVIPPGLQEGESAWPPKLEGAFLSYNHIENKGLTQLSKLRWPSSLGRLSLESNSFTDISLLTNLPEELVFLDLSLTMLSSLQSNASDSDYPYFQFPAGLAYLRLAGCNKLTFPEIPPSSVISSDYTIQERVRFKFPSSLEELDMMSCRFGSLHYFEFPKSLCKLALSGNNLTGLGSYEEIDDGVKWIQLENLVDLDLFHNRISAIDDWIPPPSIKWLDLGSNSLESIGPSAPIFSPDYKHITSKIQSISLSGCRLSNIDKNIFIPENLESLQLGNNVLSKLMVPPSLSEHRNLLNLDLSQNGLLSISFAWEPVKCRGQGEEEAHQTKTRKSKLQTLDLSGNSLMKSGRGEHINLREALGPFYDKLERGFGVKVLSRKSNVNSNHKFKR